MALSLSATTAARTSNALAVDARSSMDLCAAAAVIVLDDPSVKNVLQLHMPQVRACHDQMRELKKAVQG